MPIRIDKKLPAFATLTNENIFVMNTDIADRQDIRPLRVALLNLMPTKIVTETQILRLLSNSPLQIDVEFLMMQSHIPKNTAKSHLDSFYKTYKDVENSYFDGFIITGAPVEKMPFEEVDYWQELCKIMEWTKTHVYSTLHICWGAQAGLFYHFNIQKYPLDKKLSGIYNHKVLHQSILLKGFGDEFPAPHSRYTGIRRKDVDKHQNLTILAESDLAGVHLVKRNGCRQLFILGHCEYDRETLHLEYERDTKIGLEIDIPYNYYPHNDPSNPPHFTWAVHSNLLFSNWLNYCVYQSTPYDITAIPPI